MIEHLSINGGGPPNGELDKNWVLDDLDGLPAINNAVSGIPVTASEVTYDNLLQASQQYFPFLSINVTSGYVPPVPATITDRGILFFFFN